MKGQGVTNRSVRWHDGRVAPEDRERAFRQRPVTIWLTGLSASGKSTLAFELEHRLISSGRPCLVLDGDNVRHGLNADLGFSPANRGENVRRIAEVAKLSNAAGLIVITALISPYRNDRDAAKRIIGAARFLEVFLDAPLEVCAGRDPKGYYRKARAREIDAYTGVSAPYEKPDHPDLVLRTDLLDPSQAAAEVMAKLEAGFLIG